MKHKNTLLRRLILLAIALLLSLIGLLFYRLSESYLWTDEVFSYLAAQKIVETGKPIFDTGIEYTRSPIYHYTLAFFLENFGGSYSENLFASRIPNIFAIILTGVVTYFFTLDILKSINKGKLQLIHFAISTIPVVLFLSSNFTVALARETRMYAFAQLSMLIIAYSFYKAIVESNSTIKVFSININVIWTILLAISIIIATFIQPITLLIGIGIIIFLAYYSLIKRNYIYLLLALLAFVFMPVVGILLYETANPIEIIQFMNPNWGEKSSYIYYLLLGLRNMPIILLASPIIVTAFYYAIRGKNSAIMYTAILIVVYTIIISLLSSKNERYFQPVIPFIYISAFTAVYLVYLQFYKSFKRSAYIVLASIVTIAISLHTYLYLKELNEISTYTSTSIMQHKKLNFKEMLSILDDEIEQNKECEISADYHSAFTLYTMGYNVNNIVIPQDHIENREQKIDKYIGITYLYYEKNFEHEISDEEFDIVVIRDPDEYIKSNGITELLKRKYSQRPLLYIER